MNDLTILAEVVKFSCRRSVQLSPKLKLTFSSNDLQQSCKKSKESANPTPRNALFVRSFVTFFTPSACAMDQPLWISGRGSHGLTKNPKFPRKSEISPKIQNFPENPKFPRKSEISPKIRNFPSKYYFDDDDDDLVVESNVAVRI